MRTHVRTLAILNIVYACIALAIGVLVLLIFGGIAAVVGIAATEGKNISIPVLMGIGGLVCLIMTLLALPRLIAGIGLMQYRSWARILTIIISALGLVDFPFGTALGVYGMWVLLSQDGTNLFEGPAMRPA